jgi:hypothetical protein
VGSSQAVFIVTLNDHRHPIVTAAHELIGVAMIKRSSSVPSAFSSYPKARRSQKARDGRTWNGDRVSEWQPDQKIGKRIPDDFRRSTVRNLERANVSRSDAVKMVGQAFTAMPSPIKDP